MVCLQMSRWVQSKQEPGQFTGSTGAQILTPKELASGYQAWARRVSRFCPGKCFMSILFIGSLHPGRKVYQYF